MFYKKVALKNFVKFTGKHPWHSLFFNEIEEAIPGTLFKKETVGGFLRILQNVKNTFFTETEHIRATASAPLTSFIIDVRLGS